MEKSLIDKLNFGVGISDCEAEEIGNVKHVVPEFSFRYSFDFSNKIGGGCSGIVYAVDQGYNVFKAYKEGAFIFGDYFKSDLELMKHAVSVQNKMRKRFGECIPEVRGLFNVYSRNKGIFYPGIVMERLPGEDIERLSSHLPEKVIEPIVKRASVLWQNMLDLGFSPVYSRRNMELPLRNMIYDLLTDKIGFVDFDLDEVNF